MPVWNPLPSVIWRYLKDPEAPSLGKHRPKKSEIITLFDQISDSIDTVQEEAEAAAEAAQDTADDAVTTANTALTTANNAIVAADDAQDAADAATEAIILRGAKSGVYWLWSSLTPPATWINTGGYIGKSGSAATNRANDDTFDLFNVWWVNTTNAELQLYDNSFSPVSRGVSSAADFAANRLFPVPSPDAGMTPTHPLLKWYVRL